MNNTDRDCPVMLSICVPTYNHEKYIRQALESIFMQETQYSYEILVGEDKSTDNTKQVLQEIEKEKHKGLTVFYREKNMNDSECRNSLDLLQKSRGKYVIFLEGDDYWTDNQKIDNQITFLETHPDFIAVAHNCIVVDECSNIKDEKYEECHDFEYTLEHYACEILPGQTATVMMRNPNYITNFDMSFINTRSMPGDRKFNFTLLCYGRIACLQKKMSAYRHVTSKGDSWSANYRYDYESTKQWYMEQLHFSKKINNKKAYIIADYMLYAAIRQAFFVHHKLSPIRFLSELRLVENFWKCTFIFIRRDINRYILRKEVFFPNLNC